MLSSKTLGIDCICFTNNPKLKSDDCEIIYVETINNDPIRTAREIKTLPHKFLPAKYKKSIWVDGSIRVLQNPQKVLDELLCGQFSFFARKHDKRQCVYAEANKIISLGNGKANPKDDPEIISKQIKK